MTREKNKATNILFIQVDQLAASALHMYGNPACQTPNLDRLASEGFVFDNAYCNYPLCAPSRFSMAAGLLPSKIAAFDNGAEFPSSVPTYAHYLRGLGYYTVLSGKMHFVGPDQLHGFEQRLTSDLYPGDFQWAANWRETMHQDVTDSRMFDISGVCLNSPQIEYDQRVAFEAESKLLELAKADSTQPFFMQVSFTHPHDPYLCQQQYWDLYEGVEIPLPSVSASMISERDPHSQILLRQSGLSERVVSDEEIIGVRRSYYGAISFIDEKIGRLLAILDASGLADNTVIVFTSDHGEMLGERGMWLKKNFFEPALKVPLLIRAPQFGSARRVGELVSLVDLLPTLLAIASPDQHCETIETLDGDNLLNMLDRKQPTRNLYAELTCEGTPAPIFMLRQGDYKFTCCKNYPDQLYNLADDLNELNNLAEHPDYLKIRNKMKAHVEEKWDSETINQQVRLSQLRRQLINQAFQTGEVEPWDYQPTYNDSAWFRGETTYNEWAYSPLLPKNKLKN
jgi:choline-sulfatase